MRTRERERERERERGTTCLHFSICGHPRLESCEWVSPLVCQVGAKKQGPGSGAHTNGQKQGLRLPDYGTTHSFPASNPQTTSHPSSVVGTYAPIRFPYILLNPKATLVFFDLMCGGCHPLRVTLIFSVYRSILEWTRTETVLVSKKRGGQKVLVSKSVRFEMFWF